MSSQILNEPNLEPEWKRDAAKIAAEIAETLVYVGIDGDLPEMVVMGKGFGGYHWGELPEGLEKAEAEASEMAKFVVEILEEVFKRVLFVKSHQQAMILYHAVSQYRKTTYVENDQELDDLIRRINLLTHDDLWDIPLPKTKCIDCGKEFTPEKPSYIVCDACGEKRFIAQHGRPPYK